MRDAEHIKLAAHGRDPVTLHLALALVLVPLAFWIGRSWVEVVLLVGTVLLVGIVELLNTAVETAIEGPFRGYKKGDVLRLANGQRWQVIDGDFWAPAKTANKPRKVVIEPGSFGSFFLAIEDGGRPRVKIVGGLK